MFEQARKKVRSLPIQWQAMIEYALYLHEGALHPPYPPLPYSWHDAGSDSSGLIFGTFEATMAALDLCFIDPKFALEQVYNILSLQLPNGKIPARLCFSQNLSAKASQLSNIPLWPIVIELIREKKLLPITTSQLNLFYQALLRQVRWFEEHRKSESGGFFYLDVHDGFCESGYGLELRSLLQKEEDPLEEDCCIDTTCQLYYLYDLLATWQTSLETSDLEPLKKQESLRRFIQEELYHAPSRYFYDQWQLHKESSSPLWPSILGLWPIFTGSATPEQALSIVRDYLLNPKQFYTPHPLATISQEDPQFGPIGWNGPVRNSQLLWLMLGLHRYGLAPTITHLLERALDRTADHFLRTQTLWEFYHPMGGHPQELIQFVGEEIMVPKSAHLAHNPIIALGFLYLELRR